MLVYVVDHNGQPLMPTTRGAFVRIALKEGRAKVIRTKPFTIQLLYETTSFTQPLSGGTDPGRTNIGEAVLDAGGEVLYNAHITTRNEEIPDLMAERKAHRQASRRGERKVRQRRAIKNGTITFPLEKERTPRGCEKPIVNKYIRNSEARFVNRKRPANWLTPTTNQLVETHLNAVKDICRLLPVSDWILEINRFAFMRMEDGSIRGADFQNGRLKGYPSVNAYIFALQGGCCVCCGKPLIEHYHHIVPRHLGGSDGPENIAGLCNECHGKVHTGKLSLDKLGQAKKYAALSVLNQAIPFIYDGLVELFGQEHVHICFGWQTSEQRKRLGLGKTHDADAVCIASLGNGSQPRQIPEPYEIKQFRRHNRAIINNQRERTYKLGKETVAKNRKPRFEQRGHSLESFLESLSPVWRLDACQVMEVSKSTRYYNSEGRCMPGTVFYYKGRRYVLSGQHSYGAYFRAVGCGKKNFPARDCRLVGSGGLVYI